MKTRKNRKNSNVPAASDAVIVVSAPDAAPAPVVSDAAPILSLPAPDAAPTRRTIGAPHAMPASLDVRLTFDGRPLNGTPIGNRASLALHVNADNGATTATPAVLTPADAPRLLALAATMLASAGATIAAPDLVPAPAFDDLASTYLANRVTRTRPTPGYFAPNVGVISGPSALDRILYPTRIAERAIRAYHAVTDGKNPMFSGGYGSTDNAIARRDALTAHVSSRF